jgi:hypothetical protein
MKSSSNYIYDTYSNFFSMYFFPVERKDPDSSFMPNPADHFNRMDSGRNLGSSIITKCKSR